MTFLTEADVTTLATVSTLTGGAVAAMWRARRTVPAERNNLIVTGAETAVKSLEKSLAAESARATRLEHENNELRQAIEALKSEVADVRRQLATALRATSDTQQRISDLQDRMRPSGSTD